MKLMKEIILFTNWNYNNIKKYENLLIKKFINFHLFLSNQIWEFSDIASSQFELAPHHVCIS